MVVDLRAAAHCALDLFLVSLLSPSLCCHEELLWLSSPHLPHHHIQYTRHKIVTRNRLGLPLSKGPSAPDPPLPKRLSLWQVLQAKLSFVAAAPGSSETAWRSWNEGNNEEAAHHGPVPVPAPPSGECGCLQRKVVLSYMKRTVFCFLFIQ